jgi:hypothetical protein
MRPKKNQRPASRSSGALLALLCLLPGLALGQQSLLQGGSMTAGHLPMYSIGGTGQPIVLDAGPAGGNTTGQGVSEFNITARGTGTAPYAAQGTGVDGTIFQIQDAVSTNSTGYHYLAFSANALGGGLMEYGAAGGASALPFTFKVNGTSYSFPFVPAASSVRRRRSERRGLLEQHGRHAAEGLRRAAGGWRLARIRFSTMRRACWAASRWRRCDLVVPAPARSR